MRQSKARRARAISKRTTLKESAIGVDSLADEIRDLRERLAASIGQLKETIGLTETLMMRAQMAVYSGDEPPPLPSFRRIIN